ncbi:unknown [Eggerthella sp. CAG:298]|nr:unknown [Eggerthella sp. CAG:298]
MDTTERALSMRRSFELSFAIVVAKLDLSYSLWLTLVRAPADIHPRRILRVEPQKPTA